MRWYHSAKKKGMTLVEVLIVLAILGVSIFIVRVVVDLLTGLFQSSATVVAQRDVQQVLYEITKDIRNAKDIIFASSGTLILEMYDAHGQYRLVDNPTLFQSSNVGRLTYRYEKVGDESYLKRISDFPSRGLDEKKWLRNMLVEPDMNDYLFNACTELDFMTGTRCPPNSLPSGDDIVAVDVRLTVSPLYIKNSSVTYTSSVMRRSGWEH